MPVLFFFLKLVDSLLFLGQSIVKQIDYLLFALPVHEDNLIDVLVAVGHDSFFVDESENAHTRHLSNDVVSRVDSRPQQLPKLPEIDPVEISVLEVDLLELPYLIIDSKVVPSLSVRARLQFFILLTPLF